MSEPKSFLKENWSMLIWYILELSGEYEKGLRGSIK